MEPCIIPYLSRRESTGGNPEKGSILRRKTLGKERRSPVDLIGSDGLEDPRSLRHESSKPTSLFVGVTIVVIFFDEVELSSVFSHQRLDVFYLLIEETYLVAAFFVLDSFDVSDQVVQVVVEVTIALSSA